jgi:hypothetical protein
MPGSYAYPGREIWMIRFCRSIVQNLETMQSWFVSLFISSGMEKN